MKKYFIYCAIALLPALTFGQVEKPAAQHTENIGQEPLISSSKLSLLKDLDIIFNTRMGFDNYFVDGEHVNSLFAMNQFRLEVKGKIHDKIFFRFRNRYTKIADPNTVDNVIRGVDMAYVTIDVAPQTKLSVGKMIGNWGGYELLMNPIEILSYNTINNYADNFLVGASVAYALEDKKNSFTLQVLNSRTKTFDAQYGATVPPGIEQTEMPLVAVGNWKGRLFNNKLETTYSYSFFNDAKNTTGNYISLGNKINLNKFVLYYDFQYSQEDLDRKGVVSNIIKSPTNVYAAEDVKYVENWIRAEYAIHPKVSLLLSMMNSNAYWDGNPDPNHNNNLLKSYSVIPTVEYSPFADFNMKFFVGYVAKKNNYSSYVKNTFNAVDGTTGQISVGIIAPLLVL